MSGVGRGFFFLQSPSIAAHLLNSTGWPWPRTPSSIQIRQRRRPAWDWRTACPATGASPCVLGPQANDMAPHCQLLGINCTPPRPPNICRSSPPRAISEHRTRRTVAGHTVHCHAAATLPSGRAPHPPVGLEQLRMNSTGRPSHIDGQGRFRGKWILRTQRVNPPHLSAPTTSLP
jgi:hypothetical protein